MMQLLVGIHRQSSVDLTNWCWSQSFSLWTSSWTRYTVIRVIKPPSNTPYSHAGLHRWTMATLE